VVIEAYVWPRGTRGGNDGGPPSDGGTRGGGYRKRMLDEERSHDADGEGEAEETQYHVDRQEAS
jgi:hypothetical protein